MQQRKRNLVGIQDFGISKELILEAIMQVSRMNLWQREK